MQVSQSLINFFHQLICYLQLNLRPPRVYIPGLTSQNSFDYQPLLNFAPVPAEYTCTCCLQRTSHTYCLDCRHCSLGSLHMGLCYHHHNTVIWIFAADNPLVSCPWDHQLPVLISESSKTAMPSFHCQTGTMPAVYWSL